jgi:hypothetical protein
MAPSTPLVPQPKIWLRLVILALFVALAWIGTTPWQSKLGFCVMVAGFLGTFPRPRISAKYYEREWFAIFVPLGRSRTRLTDLTQIETDLEKSIGMAGGCLVTVVFGIQTLLMVWLLDWLLPWAGGSYKLWLRTKSGRRILAWQGNGESNFQRNMEILQDTLGLPVTRG